MTICKRPKAIAAIMAATLLPGSVTTAAEAQPSVRQQLVARFASLQQQGCMYGHQDATFYGRDWQWENNRSDVKEVCGDLPAVMGFDLGGIEMDDEKNLDSVPFTRIREEVLAQTRRGGIVTVSWHPRNPLTGGTAWDVTDNTVVREILPGGKCHAKFLTWMRRVRDFLKSLSPDSSHPTPILFRPWHENNGSWFWWGKDLCTPTEYHALWCMLQDYLLVEGLDNLAWSYSPNMQGGMTENDFLERYPGDDRVDIIGLDAYQGDSQDDYVRDVRGNLALLTAFGKSHSRLIALTECGARGTTPKKWWTEVVRSFATDYPICYALTWRNAYKDEYFGPYPGSPDATDFRKFCKADRILMLNDIAGSNEK